MQTLPSLAASTADYHANQTKKGCLDELIKALSEKTSVLKKAFPSLGVLRLDYDYPSIPGDIDCPETFRYPVFYRVVPGLTFQMCQSGHLSPQVAEEFDEAVRWLDKTKGVSAITGDCGFMMWFQRRAAQLTHKPVFLSALNQVPTVASAYGNINKIIIMTANAASLRPMRELIVRQCGVDFWSKEVIQVCCRDVPHFGEEVAQGLHVDVEQARPHIVQKALHALSEHPDAKGFILECTELPAYSDSIRRATGLPVFDAVTNADFVMHSFISNDRYAQDQWYGSWNGKQQPYIFGSELDERKRAKLVSLSKKQSNFGPNNH